MEQARRKVWPDDYRQSSETKDEADGGGLRCPKCFCKRSRVVYVRDYGKGVRVRRRECLYCHSRYSTFEKLTG